MIGISAALVPDHSNRLAQMTYLGRVVSDTRDGLERVTAIQATVHRAPSLVLSALQYRAAGAPTNLFFGNGLTETRTYN